MMKYRIFFFIFSLCFLIPSIVSLVLFGLRPAIDFTGGSLLEVKLAETCHLEKAGLEEASGLTLESIQESGECQFIIRSQPLSQEEKATLFASIQEKDIGVEELRFSNVGPVLGRELIVKTLVAIVLAATVITLYVWRQFSELKFGISAIMAMLHDTLILLGSFSLLGHFYAVEVDVLFVTAVLTTLSFSIHDTIVVYDRIRELRRIHPKLELIQIVDAAVLQTLARSINNSVTIILMLLALVLLGGETIRWFAVALLIGAVTGTYSSTFTAAPLLLLWEDVKKVLGKRK